MESRKSAIRGPWDSVTCCWASACDISIKSCIFITPQWWFRPRLILYPPSAPVEGWGSLGGWGFGGCIGFLGKFFFKTPSDVNFVHSSSHSIKLMIWASLIVFHSNSSLAFSALLLSLLSCLISFCLAASSWASCSWWRVEIFSWWVKCLPFPPANTLFFFDFLFSLACRLSFIFWSIISWTINMAEFAFCLSLYPITSLAIWSSSVSESIYFWSWPFDWYEVSWGLWMTFQSGWGRIVRVGNVWSTSWGNGVDGVYLAWEMRNEPVWVLVRPAVIICIHFKESEGQDQLLDMVFLVMIEVCGWCEVKYICILGCPMLIMMGLVQLLMVEVWVDEHVMGKFQRWLVNEIRKLW